MALDSLSAVKRATRRLRCSRKYNNAKRFEASFHRRATLVFANPQKSTIEKFRAILTFFHCSKRSISSSLGSSLWQEELEFWIFEIKKLWSYWKSKYLNGTVYDDVWIIILIIRIIVTNYKLNKLMRVFVRIFRCFVDAIRKEIILNIQKLFAYIRLLS